MVGDALSEELVCNSFFFVVKIVRGDPFKKKKKNFDKFFFYFFLVK